MIFSGGQDSTTCLIQAINQYNGRVHCITFNYGQRHHKEIDIALNISNKLGIKVHKVVDLTTFNKLTISNSLTCNNIPIPSWYNISEKLPNTFVPGRNILFLTLASIYAYQISAEIVITGVSQTDFSGYPDCRNDFIKILNQAINLGITSNIQFKTPLMHLNKAETWALADYLQQFSLIREETITCYNGIKGDGCNKCIACYLRTNGLYTYLNDYNNIITRMKKKTGLH